MTVIIVIAIIVIITIIVEVAKAQNKKSKEKSEANDLRTRTDKYKSNEKIKDWAQSLIEITENQIAASKFYSIDFIVMPYPNAISYGYNLQKVYYENIRELTENPKAIVLSQFNFSQNNLPDIYSYTDMNENVKNFAALSLAVAEIIVDGIKKSGHSAYTSNVARIVNVSGTETLENAPDIQTKIQCIHYLPPKATGEW